MQIKNLGLKDFFGNDMSENVKWKWKKGEPFDLTSHKDINWCVYMQKGVLQHDHCDLWSTGKKRCKQ